MPSFDELVSGMLEKLASAGLTDANPGSVTRTVVEIFARALEEAWYALEQTPGRFFISTATGEYLDRRAWEWGLERYPGARASGEVIVSRSTPAPFGQLIPRGTLFMYAENGPDGSRTELLYASTADTELAEGATSVSVPVQAADVGEAYNLPPGTELQQVGVAISLIEAVTVGPGGLVGGIDRESDDDLRQRLLAVIRAPRGAGTVADYQAWALAVTGVASAKCFPLARGPGTVDVLITAPDGLPTEELIGAVAAYIEERRPVGVSVRVVGPVPRYLDVAVRISPATGVNGADLVVPVSEAVRRYLSSVPVSGTVRVSGLVYAVLGVAGVEDCAVLTPAENVALAETELVLPGQIEVAW